MDTPTGSAAQPSSAPQSPSPTTPEILTSAEQRAVLTRVTARLIPLLFFCYIIAYIDRINVGFAKLHLREVLGVDPGVFSSVYGMGAGLFFIGYFLFEVPSNVILTRVGARRWICRIMATWSVISAGMAFVTGETSFIVMRFLLGVAEAGFFPGMILYLTYWYPAPYRARVIAGFMLGIPVSIAIGAPLSTTILGLDGLLGLKGWQWLFIIEGAPAVVLSAAVLCFMTDRPAHAKWLTAAERGWLEGALRDEREAINAAHGTYNPFRALIEPRVLVLSFLSLYRGSNGNSEGRRLRAGIVRPIIDWSDSSRMFSEDSIR